MVQIEVFYMFTVLCLCKQHQYDRYQLGTTVIQNRDYDQDDAGFHNTLAN